MHFHSFHAGAMSVLRTTGATNGLKSQVAQCGNRS